MSSHIKRINIVTSIGMSCYYTVGEDGITSIELEQIQISTDSLIDVYQVKKGDNIYAQISASCPLEIIYE